ncbi:hypothetical protein GCM10027275_28830 [Rhabdobacter roseus]|uniref:Protein SCO1/2 n=1 Tax=Rhabdobacter roseus TaxID=1655419 RepID=A0A840TU99_9BACT|nr:hypothetical protein [Rhabdobacter roseus]MBB5284833.1 protein SCO1/2 [Rhabdobacter roseus]
MNAFRKAGLLIIVLVVPVLVFLFLKLFGTNHFDLPYYFPLTDPRTGEVSKAGEDTLYYRVSNFTLQTVDGQAIDEKSLNGKVIVAHTTSGCDEGTCQKVLAQVQRVSTLASTIDNLRVLTILPAEVDSSTQQIMTGYKAQGWLVQNEDEMSAERIFKLNESPSTNQTIPLTSRLVLIDPQGYIRGYYDALNPEDVDRLMVEIKILDYGSSLPK